ncbi:MAG: hypothetical protein ACRDAM_16175 [Casimicrobium sp.]
MCAFAQANSEEATSKASPNPIDRATLIAEATAASSARAATPEELGMLGMPKEQARAQFSAARAQQRSTSEYASLRIVQRGNLSAAVVGTALLSEHRINNVVDRQERSANPPPAARSHRTHDHHVKHGQKRALSSQAEGTRNE